MKAWIFRFSVSLLCASSTSLAAGSAIAYDDLPDIIRKNNKAVQASTETIKAASLRVGTLERNFLPRAGFEAGVAEQKEANGVADTAPFWKVDVQSNLYRGGRDKLSQLLRESQVLVKELDAQALFRSEIFKAKTTYVELVSIRQIKDLTEQSMDDYDSLAKSIKAKARAGLITSTALQTSQLEIDELKRQRILLESREHELEDRLSLALGIAPDEKLSLTTQLRPVEGTIRDPSEDGTIEEIPEIKRFALVSKTTKTEAETRNEWWLPDVNVFASYVGFAVERRGDFGSLPTREMSLGLRFSIDLESKEALNSELFAKHSELASLQLQKEHLTQEIRHKLHEYHREMDTQLKLGRSYDSGISNSEKLLGQIRKEFERGIGGSDSVTGVIRSIYDMKRKRLETMSDYYLARAGLEAVTDLGGK